MSLALRHQHCPSVSGLILGRSTQVRNSFLRIGIVMVGFPSVPSLPQSTLPLAGMLMQQRKAQGPCFPSGWPIPGPFGRPRDRPSLARIILNLGKEEKEHGLTYVAFSRVKKLEDIGIVGDFSRERFTLKIANQSKMAPRKREERRIRDLAEETVEMIAHYRAYRANRAATTIQTFLARAARRNSQAVNAEVAPAAMNEDSNQAVNADIDSSSMSADSDQAVDADENSDMSLCSG